MIFEKDVNEVLNADILFMVLDGRVPDEGAKFTFMMHTVQML